MSTQSDGTYVPSNLDSNQIHTNFPFLSKNQRYGLKVEQWVFDQLVERGYSPTIPPDFKEKFCDMRVNGLCIEVKAAKKTKRRRITAQGEVIYYYRWQWHIPATHRGEYALILIADTGKKRAVFVIPGSQVGDRMHLQLTSHPDKYSGWLAQYRDRWDLIDYLVGQVYADNGPLFYEWERAGERVAA